MYSNPSRLIDYSSSTLGRSIEVLVRTAQSAPLMEVIADRDGKGFRQLGILRLDKIDSCYGDRLSGNKLFKLMPLIDCLRTSGVESVASFGGPWSNHLWSLSAMTSQHGMRAQGLINGEMKSQLTPTLYEARQKGMLLTYLSRRDFKRLMFTEGWNALPEHLPNSYVIPIGGASNLGVLGAIVLGQVLQQRFPLHEWRCAAGSAVTSVGLAIARAGMSPSKAGRVVALTVADSVEVAAARAERTAQRFFKWLLDEPAIAEILGLSASAEPGAVMQALTFEDGRSLSVLSGGTRTLAQSEPSAIMGELIGAIELDPVYTGPLIAHFQQQWSAGLVDARDTLLIHTGGAQGLRRFGDESFTSV